MDTSLIRFTAQILLAALYLPVLFLVIQRRQSAPGTSAWALTFYVLLSLVLAITEAVWRGGQSEVQGLQDLQIFGAFLLMTLQMLLVRAFLRRENWLGSSGAFAFWGLSLGLILTNGLSLPEVLWTNGSLVLMRERLGPGWAILGWLSYAIGLIILIADGIRSTRQQLLRNRISYWWAALFLVFINDILLFSNLYVAGNPVRVAAVALMAYIVTAHNPPDLRNIMRQAVAYLLITIVVIGLYISGYLIATGLLQSAQGFNPLWAGAVIALIISLVFAPLQNGVSRLVNSWLRADQYDASRTIHQYSESISNILDMDKLAGVAVGIILESMQIERGFLFLVDTDYDPNGVKIYRLRPARNPEERQMVAVELRENDPVAAHFLREQRPLLQYDLDLLPAFQTSSSHEREWFERLQAEVYIPIFAKRQWIGMFAFGAKISGNRYTPEDLMILGSHANQTAVALENARLVDNLMRLNNELRSARRQLEKNNRDLERLDQAKSDFISIASHELRTPLTVIKGYVEMMLEDDSVGSNAKALIKGVHDGTLRLHEIMESMFDIAQIDMRALKLHLQPVEIGLLLHEVCIEQQKTVKERGQTIRIDLPPLPHIASDPNLLRKMFHHLLNNASKFTPNGGKITITGNHIPPIIDMPNGGVEIIFSDTGVGVDPQYREIIFTKFYQPGDPGRHSTSKSRFKGGGAGLGLALSKGIVEAHGGRIYVESPGYDENNFPGSQFHIILPLIGADGAAKPQTSLPVQFEV